MLRNNDTTKIERMTDIAVRLRCGNQKWPVQPSFTAAGHQDYAAGKGRLHRN